MNKYIFQIVYKNSSRSLPENIKKLIEKKLGDRFSIVKNYFGKPYIYTQSKLYPYSISRSNGIEVIVFSTDIGFLIGVDIETMKTINFGFKNKFLSPKEIYQFNFLEKNEDKKKYFYSLFSIKEAVGKSIGIGISDELQKLSLGEKICLTKNSSAIKCEYLGRKFTIYLLIGKSKVYSLALSQLNKG